MQALAEMLRHLVCVPQTMRATVVWVFRFSSISGETLSFMCLLCGEYFEVSQELIRVATLQLLRRNLYLYPFWIMAIFIQGKRSWGMYNERNLRDDRYKRQILVCNDHKKEGRDGAEKPRVTQWWRVEMGTTR